MNKKTSNLSYAAFYFLISAFLFVWFSKIHALVPYDGDDWTYLAYVRRTTPIWGAWNPAKVFPEVVFPFVSTIAAFVLAPLTHDYITAQTMIHALVVSLSITGYLWCFSCMLRRCFPCSQLTASLITLVFLTFHFLAMRSADWNNQYLFYCVDLNCYYNYLLPSLLNASIVMSLVANASMEEFLKSGSPVKKGCCYIVVYLAIFSNLPSSGILAAYAGSVLLLDLIHRWKQKHWKRVFADDAFYWGILAAWFISAVFELSGGRAASATSDIPLYYQVYLTCKALADVILNCNRVFLFTALGVILAACIVLIRTKPNSKAICASSVLLIAFLAYSAYLLLLCAVVNPDCVSRSEYLLGIFFFGMLLSMLALAFLLERFPKLLLVFPLLVFFLVSAVDTGDPTFAESNFSKASPELCAEISRNLIQQIQEADQNGLSEVVLRVPVHVSDPEAEDNWPHSLFLMERIPGTLYAHGLIQRNIRVVPVADPEMNVLFNLPIPSK